MSCAPASLHELAKAAHDVATDRGWDKADWDANFGAKIMLVITELDEAVQWVDGIGKDPVCVELADASIRMLAIIHGIWGDSWSPGRISNRLPPNRPGAYSPIEVLLWPIVRRLCSSVESWRRNGEVDKKDAAIYLELALLETFRLADRLNIDLIDEIVKKSELNASRPKLHNKGRSVG